MTATCPAGHASATEDYCDQCGAPIAPGPTTAQVAPVTGEGLRCSHCGAPYEAGDAFCEVCGLDFATGELPAAPPLQPAAPVSDGGATPKVATGTEAAAEWFVAVEADRSFFDTNRAETGATVAFPDAAAPRDVELRGDEALIGRRSERAGVFPDIDCATPVEDPGVSRRHAVLRRVAGHWEIVDQGSTNGTRVNGRAVAPGEAVRLAEGDVVHLGAWTRLTLRRRGAR